VQIDKLSVVKTLLSSHIKVYVAWYRHDGAVFQNKFCSKNWKTEM